VYPPTHPVLHLYLSDCLTLLYPPSHPSRTLHFTHPDIEREYFALKWGARRDLLRRAVPMGALIAVAVILWTIRTPDADGQVFVAPSDVPRPVWIAVCLTVIAALWLMIVPLSMFAAGRGGRRVVKLVPSFAEVSMFGMLPALAIVTERQ